MTSYFHKCPFCLSSLQMVFQVGKIDPEMIYLPLGFKEKPQGEFHKMPRFIKCRGFSEEGLELLHFRVRVHKTIYLDRLAIENPSLLEILPPEKNLILKVAGKKSKTAKALRKLKNQPLEHYLTGNPDWDFLMKYLSKKEK